MHMQVSGSSDDLGGGLSAAWSTVAAFASAMDASLDKWLVSMYRVGLTEHRALTLLSRTHDKELRVSALAERLGLNQSSATRLVSRLEAKGFARRDLCQDDGRGVYAVISEQGEALLREVRQPFEARVQELLPEASAQFPQLDARELSRALREVGALVGK